MHLNVSQRNFLKNKILEKKKKTEESLQNQQFPVFKKHLEAVLSKCNDALIKIENGTYGTCSVSQKPIPYSDLTLNPLRDTLIRESPWIRSLIKRSSANH